MQQSIQYKIIATITLSVSCLAAIAQGKAVASIEVDTLTKVIGIGITLVGFFMGYMQMRMAIKIAAVEAQFTKAIAEVKDKFEDLLEKETEKLDNKIQTSSEKTEDRIQLSVKVIEAKMATRHDIDNVKTVMKLQHELTTEQMKNLKEQLTTAARIYKRDNE